MCKNNMDIKSRLFSLLNFRPVAILTSIVTQPIEDIKLNMAARVKIFKRSH